MIGYCRLKSVSLKENNRHFHSAVYMKRSDCAAVRPSRSRERDGVCVKTVLWSKAAE